MKKSVDSVHNTGEGKIHLSKNKGASNSEDFGRDIFNCIGSPILIIDPQTAAILNANEAACHFYGYSHSEFIKKKILDLAVIPVEEAWQRIQKIEAGEITHMTLQHRLANGEIRDVDVDLGRGNVEGKLVNIATVHDITERKRAEQTLQGSQRFVSQAVEAFTLVDEHGVVIEWNPASEQLTGIPASEVLGQLVWDVQLRVTSPDNVTAEMRDQMRQRIENILQTGSGPMLGTYETEIKRADGKTIIATQKLFTIKTARGFQIGTIARDITRERQTQKDLKVSEERYRLLFENMREGFSLYEVIKDENDTAIDARILAANAAYELHTRLKPVDVIGRTILEVVPQTSLSQLEPYFKVAQTGESISLEYFSVAFQRHFRTETFCPKPGQFATIVEDITERKQAEQALRESEERFSTVFHSSHDSISIHRLTDNIFLDVNEAFSTIFGLSREQIIGHTGREFYTPLDPAEREEMMRSLRSQGQFTDFEAHFHNRQGQAGYLLLSGKIINLSGEECLLLFGKDITLRKQAEAALKAAHDELERRVLERTVELRRSLERLDLATDAAKMGIWDWDIQKNELVWDRQMYTLYGVKPEDFGGAYEAWLNGIHPEDRETSEQVSEQARKGEIPYDTEFRILWPDGSVRWLKANGQVFWDEQGKPIRMLGVNYDITEHKKAVDEICESEEKFSKAFYDSPIARAIARESDGNIENVNTRFTELFEYPLEQVINHTPFDLGLAQRDEDFEKMTQIIMHERKNLDNYENVVHLRSGKDLNILISSAFITLNQVKYLLLTFVDVTALKQAEQKLTETNLILKKALRAKDEFMAVMSHELRTPINGIMGMAELLQMTATDTLDEKQLNYLAFIEKNSQRLTNMVNNVLEYTQVQAGAPQLDFRTCSLDEACKIALQKIAPQAELKKQQPQCFVNPPDITISTDAIQLHKTLLLLLDNASKFTISGGEFGIEVIGKSETRLVEITVWDTGIGIAEEELPRLFKPFVQLDASLARQYEGAGLGLALAKGLTELLGGNLTVQSTFGKGSRFTVTLPWK